MTGARNRFATLCGLVCAFCLGRTSAEALPPPPTPAAWPRPELRLDVGVIGGLDGPRGAVASLGLAVREVPFTPSASVSIEGDSLLATWFLEETLRLEPGPGLAILVGIAQPLMPPALTVEGGRRLLLATSAVPSRFGVEATLFDRPISPQVGFTLVVEGCLTALRIATASGGDRPGYASQDAVGAFSAGFQAALAGRLSIRPAP